MITKDPRLFLSLPTIFNTKLPIQSPRWLTDLHHHVHIKSIKKRDEKKGMPSHFDPQK